MYDAYIAEEVVPFIHGHCQTPGIGIFKPALEISGDDAQILRNRVFGVGGGYDGIYLSGNRGLIEKNTVEAVKELTAEQREANDLSDQGVLVTEVVDGPAAKAGLAVDHEGGRVQRFRSGFSELPAAAQIGEVYDGNPKEGLAFARQCGSW